MPDKEAINSLNSSVSEYLRGLNPQPPKVLYHYSSIKALHQIVSTKSIWASNLHYLNDSREFTLGIEIANKLLEVRKSKPNSNNDVLEKMLKSMGRNRQYSAFIVSFSERGDLLSQWRAYCPTQGGYSLGFSCNLLQARAKNIGFALCQCVYNSSQQERMVQEVIDIVLSHLGGLYHPNQETDLQTIEIAFLLYMLPVASLIKHSSFSEEEEWRLVSLPLSDIRPNIKYRPNNSMLVPYFEFALAEEPVPLELDEVIVGPNLNPDLARLSVEAFLKSRSIVGRKEVKMSVSPYRGV